MTHAIWTLVIFLLMILSVLPIQYSSAKDLGVHGKVSPILEQDMLESIRSKLRQLEASGAMERLNQKMLQRTKDYLHNPSRIAGITKTTETKIRYYDPSITLSQDLADQDGKVFYKAGTYVNPLDKINLTRALIFIDGEDSAQVKWAVAEYKKRKAKCQIILIAGPLFALMGEHQIRMYYDQRQILTDRFSIKHVPTLIEQEDKRLRITELAL